MAGRERGRQRAAPARTDHGAAFSTAEEVLAHDRMRRRSCELLLTDVRLPGASGLALRRALRQHHPNVKVLLTIGYVDDPAHAAVIEIGELPSNTSHWRPSSSFRRVRSVLDG